MYLKVEIHTAHESGKGHGVALIDFVALSQEVLASEPKADGLAECIVDCGIQQAEVFLLFVLANSSVEVAHILYACNDGPSGIIVVYAR